MGDGILLRLFHFCVRLTLVLEDGIPAENGLAGLGASGHNLSLMTSQLGYEMGRGE